jgi:hypothetical protein
LFSAYVRQTIVDYFKIDWKVRTFNSTWINDIDVTYQADDQSPILSKQDRCRMLIDILEQEERVLDDVRHAENEVRCHLTTIEHCQ